MEYDLVISGGKIIDGSGNPWFKANIGVKDGKITNISRNKLDANNVLDVDKLTVTPGFINPHGHMDWYLHEENIVLHSIAQGVTTECTGNCGVAIHTMSEDFTKFLRQYYETGYPDWRSLEEWRKKREKQGIGLNIAPFLGFGTIRSSVMGLDGHGGERYKPTVNEFEQMKAFVVEGMEDGAFGITIGLSYEVQRNASTEEIIQLAKVVEDCGGVFMAHARGGSKSILEFIEICEKTPISGCLSHVTIATNLIQMAQFKEARERGVEIFLDLYPWIHGSGKSLGYWLFGHQHENLLDPVSKRFMEVKDLNDSFFTETAKKLKDEAKWLKIKTAAIERVQRINKANEERKKNLESYSENVIVSPIREIGNIAGIVYSPSHPEFEGDDTNLPYTLKEVAMALGSSDVWEAARELFIVDKGKTLIVNASPKPNGRREKHVIATYRMPESIVSSDSSNYTTHPRGWGSWPKVLQRYVRELGILRLEDAIRKMTSLPAQFLGLNDRGIIKPGMFADIVIFNPDNIKNKATYRKPREYPEGIPYVIINGKIVINEGQYTGALPGKILRKI